MRRSPCQPSPQINSGEAKPPNLDQWPNARNARMVPVKGTERHEAFVRDSEKKNGPASECRHRPAASFHLLPLSRDDRHDFQCVRVNNHDLVLDEEVIEAAVLWHDPHDILRQGHKVHTARDSRPDADVKVDVAAKPRAMRTPDDRLHLRTLILGQLHRSTVLATLADVDAGPTILLGRVALGGCAALLASHVAALAALFLGTLHIGAALLLGAFEFTPFAALLLSALQVLSAFLLGALLVLLQAAVLLRTFLLVLVALAAHRLVSLFL